ncbi:glycoside hydrolase family 13 protein [Gleimia sp. 6138-11-ORH1]|uniref:glycoside hydrolase family 13 protein n=1 Tax=Gleimia sp. 6138-11-ORH1 TaxID=2973937 RepID=UPI00216979CE|nr:glycoside hydrolase family 13 protein [Gleimia sp. 6138-11-ORH1]MCS4485005.1 glycoside hydrolase family 13 protein [Gleimia sp. 6138-11-ORH1]
MPFENAVLLHRPTQSSQWWRSAVIYQIYPRSYASAGVGTQPGVGDLPGITQRLDHIAELGADAIWLSPFYVSPQKDGGYDVSNYRDVDPLFGTLADADALLTKAKELGLKVIVDLVPNHTSDQHQWFQDALAAGIGSAERERYIFRPGTGENGELPPNDWESIFGSIAWTRVCDRADAPGSAWENDPSWYLHLFDSSQPDLNWEHPEVREEFHDILRFWLSRGVAGFRVDVAHGLVKDPTLPNWQFHWKMVDGGSASASDVPPPPMWNLEGVHEIYREWRKVLDEFDTERILVAEAWVSPERGIAKYVRADEMNQSFNFDFLCCEWEPTALREVISKSLAAMDQVGAPTTWVLSNHDVVRAASRMGLSKTGKGPNGIRSFEEQPNQPLALRRAKAAHALMLALPGSAYIYQGEELGLPEHTMLPDSVRQDPAFFRTQQAEAGRDGCRVPLPWEANAPGFGFSPTGDTWLPQPLFWEDLAIDRQLNDPNSHLSWYRHMLQLRKRLQLAEGGLLDVTGFADLAGFGLAYVNQSSYGEVVVATTFTEPTVISSKWQVLFSSADLITTSGGLEVPADTTVWLK